MYNYRLNAKYHYHTCPRHKYRSISNPVLSDPLKIQTFDKFLPLSLLPRIRDHESRKNSQLIKPFVRVILLHLISPRVPSLWWWVYLSPLISDFEIFFCPIQKWFNKSHSIVIAKTFLFFRFQGNFQEGWRLRMRMPRLLRSKMRDGLCGKMPGGTLPRGGKG